MFNKSINSIHNYFLSVFFLICFLIRHVDNCGLISKFCIFVCSQHLVPLHFVKDVIVKDVVVYVKPLSTTPPALTRFTSFPHLAPFFHAAIILISSTFPAFLHAIVHSALFENIAESLTD